MHHEPLDPGRLERHPRRYARPRERLVESLDRIFAEPIDRKYNRDSIEGKVFGLGLESYTAGSHEFYTNYALTTGKAMVCMDTGHYHPTESVAAKLSSYFVFGQEIMTHLSRAVRWDSDHVATVSEDTVAIMQEIKRCNAFDQGASRSRLLRWRASTA